MALTFGDVAPGEAVDAFAARGIRFEPSFSWRDIYAAEHAAMFTVAKSAGFDILADIYKALEAALKDGSTPADFSRRIRPLLIDKGWWGRETVTDPASGERRLAQLGSARRLKLIFETNMRVSHATGHWARFERLKAERPYLRYVAVKDDRTRPSHMAMHNICLPVDDPFWETHAPPNGWNCRCTLQSLRTADVRRLIAEGEDLRLEAPAVTTRPWLNDRTGEIRRIPDGIDPGWDYNPGKAGHDETVRRLNERMEAGQMFAKAQVAERPPPTPRQRDALAALLERDQDAWAATLSPAEKAVIADYKSSGYRLINAHLRGGAAAVERMLKADSLGMSQAALTALADEAAAKAAVLREAITRARLLRDITAYRRAGDPLSGLLKTGAEFVEPGFQSGSLQLAVSQKGFKGSLIEFRLRSGLAAAYVHAIPFVTFKEYEVIIAPGLRWRVTGRIGRRWIVEAA